MKDEDFELLVTSVRQAGRIKRGEMKPARKVELRPEDVKAIRSKLDKSQSEFALMIGGGSSIGPREIANLASRVEALERMVQKLSAQASAGPR